MTIIRFRNSLFPLSLALILAASVTGQNTGSSASPQPTGTTIVSPPQTSSPALQPRYPRYVIQREDVLMVTFPLSPELNQTVTVQPDGFVNLQSAGSLHVQGLTVPEMVGTVEHAYTGILRDPIVDIDLQDFQKAYFTVTGQVGKPGQYELRSDLSVTEAIAVAGGLQPTAKTQVFLFHKTPDGAWFQVERVNLKEILRGKKITEDAMIKAGDMVFVPENTITKFRKYVPYSVNAGSYLAENQ